MTVFIQQLVDGLSRGGTYALLALGLAVIFGIMRLVNFAHGELITVTAYAMFFLLVAGSSWWLVVPLAVLAAVAAAVGTERIAFRKVRGSDVFTMLLTSFGLGIIIQAVFRMYVSATPQQFARPDWIFARVRVLGLSLEIYSLVVIGVTAVVLLVTAWLVQRTTFGVSMRAAAEDFDAARLMGVRADRTIAGVFALAGLLAGVAGLLLLIRSGTASPAMGITPLLKGLVAAIVGGLGSLGGAVAAGLLLGVSEVLIRSLLPGHLEGLTDGVIFALIAILFTVRPQGLFTVVHAERV